MKKTTKTTIKEITKEQAATIFQAAVYGRMAYKEGKKAAAQDKNVMSLIGDKDITIAILDAWNNEWQAAHLEAVGLK